jgi:hypothetical protein
VTSVEEDKDLVVAKSFLAVLLSRFLDWHECGEKKVHVVDIPDKKLINFLSACESSGVTKWMEDCADRFTGQTVSGISPGIAGVFGLVDCTLFGGGKESIALCWGGLAFKAIGKDPGKISWEDLMVNGVKSSGILSPTIQVGCHKIDFNGSDLSHSKVKALVSDLNGLRETR